MPPLVLPLHWTAAQVNLKRSPRARGELVPQVVLVQVGRLGPAAAVLGLAAAGLLRVQVQVELPLGLLHPRLERLRICGAVKSYMATVNRSLTPSRNGPRVVKPASGLQ